MSFKAMPPWSSAKTKVQLRISVQRLRILQEKKEAQAKSARRDIATLLEARKIEKARVKVENIINEDIHVELLELLELYCELLLARFGLLEQNTREPDPGISEGVCCIIYAAPRTELKELHVLRDILMHKYGREYSIAVMENKDDCVSERVMKKCAYLTPPPELVSAYLQEIAKGYGIDWTPPEQETSDNLIEDNATDELETLPSYPEDISSIAKEKLQSDTLGDEGKLKLPDIPGLDAKSKSSELTSRSASKSPGEPGTGADTVPKTSSTKATDDPFDMLVKRFEALKRK